MTSARDQARSALLDAAEELLVKVGYGQITTRRLAEQAGVNHGLVHYYFGSMQEVFLQTLERFTDRLIERQRDLYSAQVPFVEKWRAAMRFLTEDTAYQKVFLELQAMAWNDSDLRDRVVAVLARWVDVLRPAFAAGFEELGLAADGRQLDAAVVLVATFNQGIMLEQLLGADSGHQALLDAVDAWLETREPEPEPAPAEPARTTPPRRKPRSEVGR
jgi:AcrR family transcriptional regulator